ncbi:MAG TPA: SIS domain-containing protein [Actinomycetes bacterium]|nr:SIS domain-containing protein [Actinomycetes bacterium]
MTRGGARAVGLDDPAELAGGDPGGMLGLVASGGRQARTALAAARGADLAGPVPSAMVVAGMGGSGIAGDVLAALALTSARVPVLTVKSDRLPGFVGPGTLLVAVSYSGGTDETLSAAEQGLAAGARLVTVASGGRLAELAEAHQVPRVPVPPGMPPRAALWSLAIPVLAAAEAAGVLPGATADVPALADALDAEDDALGPAAAARRNPAKAAAGRLLGRLPVVWGTGVLGAVAATRLRAQCNENAKVSAIGAALPEADHNEVMALEGGLGPDRELVVLRDEPGEHPRDPHRLEAVLEAIGLDPAGAWDAGAPGAPVLRRAGTGPALVRLARLVVFADYTSVYLALARGVDPAGIATIERVKAGVAARAAR